MVQIDTLEKIVTVLNEGGLILYPTDTIWGIGCDATNAEAIEKVFQLKNRAKNNPLILLADSITMIENYVVQVHPKISTLLQYHVRPLTVIYDSLNNLPNNVIGQDGTVAFRIPQDNFCKELISQFGKPIVSTSANKSTAASPANFGAISSEIIEGVDYVVKAYEKENTSAEPSVIVKLSDRGELIFIRA